MVLPPPHLLKMPQAHKPPPAPCLPPTTMQCLATLALTLLALEASLALAPALSLQFPISAKMAAGRKKEPEMTSGRAAGGEPRFLRRSE
ncbi:hypothetical protein AB1E18_003208 [Capra hircus]